MHTLADTVIVFCSRCSRVTLPLTVEEVRGSTGGKARPFAENNFHISPLSAFRFTVSSCTIILGGRGVKGEHGRRRGHRGVKERTLYRLPPAG